MSTLSTTEAALLTLLRTRYATEASSRGDFRVMDAQGVTYSAVVVQRAASRYSDRGENGRGAHGKRQHVHRLRVILGAKRGQGGDGSAYVGIQDEAAAVVALLDARPRLGGTVSTIRRAEVVEESAVLVPSERAMHLLKYLDLDVACEVAWNPAEASQ